MLGARDTVTKLARAAQVGKRRLHVKPNYTEVTACTRWLLQELELVRPRIVACLGATAGQSFFGRDFRAEARAQLSADLVRVQELLYSEGKQKESRSATAASESLVHAT